MRYSKNEDVDRLDTIPAQIVAEEILSAAYLSESVWSQVFDTYRLHFSTELPFVHLATLKEKMVSRFRDRSSDTSPDLKLVLLGILTLTARFNPTLVAYATSNKAGATVNPKTRQIGVSQDATEASQYYAKMLTKVLGGLEKCMTVASVERVQAFLMLGLYEWSQTQPKTGGLAAWMYVGTAIRMAQALGLSGGDKEDGKTFRSRVQNPAKAIAPPSQVMITMEIRRRTMYSCLILDRLLGCGKGRAFAIRSEDLLIQLPCSEIAFDLSEPVYTGFLKPTAEDKARAPVNDSVLGRFIRLVDIWGDISKWSFAGGRFTEEHPPWSPLSQFYQLRVKLDTFYGELPELFRWSSSNYYKHENHQASSGYVSMHLLGAVCRIMLHREYIPFIPLRCEKPIGPLDPPTFRAGEEPEGFWNKSSEDVFRAARDVIDLIDICRDKLPMSTLVLFAVWTAAFVGIYAFYFPHMDVKGHMLLSSKEEEGVIIDDVTKVGATGRTFKTLSQMSTWLKMAETYVGYFHDMVQYYNKVKQDYDMHMGKAQQVADGKLIGGGGLEEWKQHGLKICNNGEIMAVNDDDRGEGTPERHAQELAAAATNSSSLAPDGSSFTPINSGQHHQSVQEAADHSVQSENGISRVGMESRLNHNTSSGWPRNRQASQSQPPQGSQAQQSPSQSSFAMPSPQMAQAQDSGNNGSGVSQGTAAQAIPNLPFYTSTHEVAEYIAQAQSLPWQFVPGGLDDFAQPGHTSDDSLGVLLDPGAGGPSNVWWVGGNDSGGGGGSGTGGVHSHAGHGHTNSWLMSQSTGTGAWY